MRIIILSDSLGRPRPDLIKDKTEYEDIYGYKLKQYFKNDEVEICYIESLDSDDALFWSQRMVAFRKPDIVIFHLGINDCAPRMFKKGSKSILLNPFFKKITRDLLMKLIHKYRYVMTKYLKKTYTTQRQFKQNFIDLQNEVKKYNPKALFFAISICYVPKFLSERSYGYNTNISQYNKILEELFADKYIEINALLNPEEIHIADGIHLTTEAHTLLAKELIKQIEKTIK